MSFAKGFQLRIRNFGVFPKRHNFKFPLGYPLIVTSPFVVKSVKKEKGVPIGKIP